MSLSSKQDEWSNLLSIESIQRPSPSVDTFKHLSLENRFDLSASWVCDGIHARHTDYPETAEQIKYFKWSRSALLRSLFNCAVVIQIFSTFLDNTSCDHEYKLDDKLFYPNGAPTRLALTIFDLLCLTVYLSDLFLSFAVNPKHKSLLSKPWSTFRLLICLFVLLDCLIYFVDPTQPRLMRCLYPFLLISKRNNLKLMCQGLFVSAYKSLPIIKALVSILVMWGFAGFFFFRATDTDTLAFSSPGSGIAEALHCFTSRPYVLKALDSIYPQDQAAALYFVSLTLAADILCIGLIVAVGAKHYKLFAGRILHARLVDRRHAVSCAFCALTCPDQGARKDSAEGSEDDGNSTGATGHSNGQCVTSHTIDRKTWLALCTYITGKYSTTTHTANFIFDLVVESDTREHRYTNEGTYTNTSTEVNSNSNNECMDEYLFFRACALIATRIVIQIDNDEAVSSNGDINSGNVSVDMSEGQGDGYELPLRNSVANPLCASETDTKNSENSASDAQNPNSVAQRTESVVVNAELQPGADPSTIRVAYNRTRASHTTQAKLSLSHQLSALDTMYTYLKPVRVLCVHITGAQITVGGGRGGQRQWTVSVFYAARIILLLLMVIDLCFLSSSTRALPAFYCACVLESCFWLHLLVRVTAVGVRRFASFYENRGDTLLNVASLVAIIKLGQEYLSNDFDFHSSLALGWYLLVQCARLFKLFFVVNDVKIFEHMRPVLVRASFIYFSVIYFFSIFGYSYFCNAMNVTDAQNTSASNDASQWVQYSNLLNFNTLLQSLFTLFQLSLLGNWSIVMDAAVASTNHPASAYIFFYAYRLCITLFVLPILLSFLIQVFLSALSVQEKEVEMQRVVAAQAYKQHQQRLQSNSSSQASFLSRAVSTTQVSYNVNQEVLVLGRAHRVADRMASTESEQSSHHYSSNTHSVDSTQDTISPVSEHIRGDASNHSSRSNSPVRAKLWRPSVSIKIGVNKHAATAARDKHSESIARASSHHRHAPRESEWGGSSSSEDQDSHHTSAATSVDRGVSAPPSPRSRGHLAGDHEAHAATVTVQYDSKGASSMMSIWSIADNAHIPKLNTNLHSLPSHGQDDSSEVASLRAQLQAALHALNVQKLASGTPAAQEDYFL